MYNCSKIIHSIIEKNLTSVLNVTETTQENSSGKKKKNIYAYIYNQSETDNVKNGLFWLEMRTVLLTEKPIIAWYCVGKMFLTFWHLHKDIFDNHKKKKNFCLLIFLVHKHWCGSSFW